MNSKAAVPRAVAAEPLRVLVPGAGVIRSVYAARLIHAGHRVVMLARGQWLAGLHARGLVPESAFAIRHRRRVLASPRRRADVRGPQPGRARGEYPPRPGIAGRRALERAPRARPRRLALATGNRPGGPMTPRVTQGPAAGRPPPLTGRRPELDVVRALVVAGLVVFHSAVVFAKGTSWFVKDPRPSVGFTVFLLWGSLWGMPLLFLVSGMGARYAMRARPPAAFARERLARLGIPFVTGLVLLVPPMFYLEQLAQPGVHQPYWRFWLTFMNTPSIVGGLLPHGSWTSDGVSFDPAHLWFLYVLLVLSLVLLPLFSYLRRPPGRQLFGQIAGLGARHPVAMLAVAAVPMMVTEAVFGPSENTGGWERVAYVFPFAYGFLIAGDARFESALARARWPALAAAVAATGGLLAWAAALNAAGTSVMTGAAPGWGALQGLAGWAWLVAIVGFGAAVTASRRKPGTAGQRPAAAREPRWRPAARYANQAVLPFYLLHEPVIVAFAWIIVRWHAPTLVKYPALMAVSFTATLAIYELAIRRYRATRFLFGMKPPPATGNRPPGPSSGVAPPQGASAQTKLGEAAGAP